MMLFLEGKEVLLWQLLLLILTVMVYYLGAMMLSIAAALS